MEENNVKKVMLVGFNQGVGEKEAELTGWLQGYEHHNVIWPMAAPADTTCSDMQRDRSRPPLGKIRPCRINTASAARRVSPARRAGITSLCLLGAARPRRFTTSGPLNLPDNSLSHTGFDPHTLYRSVRLNRNNLEIYGFPMSPSYEARKKMIIYTTRYNNRISKMDVNLIFIFYTITEMKRLRTARPRHRVPYYRFLTQSGKNRDTSK